MTENSSASSSWEKLVPEKSDQSAAMRFHLVWDTMALRKIHDASDVPGTFDILLLPDPVPPAVWTPDQLEQLAAANLPRPIFPDPPEPAATAIEVSRYTSALAFHKIINDRFRRQHDAKISLKDKMLESLDQTTLDLVLPNRDEYNTITFQDLYNRVKAHFQNITPAHLMSIEADIKSPLIFSHPNSYSDHIAKHVHLNRGLVAAARTRSEIDKISDLRASLLTSPHAATFSTFLDYYDATHRTLASQSFTDMHEACSAAIPTLLATLSATTSNSQFGANGALKKPTLPGKGSPNPRPIGNKPAAYCWTHGNTYHSSDKCRNKAPGHQDKATAANKMGGK
jgi:hypothetical protein